MLVLILLLFRRKFYIERRIAVGKLKMINIVVIPPCMRYNFPSIKLRFLGKKLWFILASLLHLALSIFMKAPLAVTSNYIYVNKLVISLPWKKTCHYRYTIFFVFFRKSMRKPDAQHAHFSYLFQETDRELHCVNFLKASWSSSGARPVLSSLLNEISSKGNFKTYFRLCMIS